MTVLKTCVKIAERAFRFFYFGKNKMRFFQNNLYIPTAFRYSENSAETHLIENRERRTIVVFVNGI